MKILHLLDHSLPVHDGYSMRSHNILKNQIKHGLSVCALTSLRHEKDTKTSSSMCDHIDGISYYRIGGDVDYSRVNNLATLKSLRKRIQDVVRIEHPDIIHAHSPVLTALPALSLCRQLKIPICYEIRAFWEDAAVDQGKHKEGSLKYRLIRALETWVCRRVQHVTVICNGLKNDLIARGIPAGKITPVFNGVNPDDFTPCPPDDEFRRQWGLTGKQVVGFIGSFYRYEGLDLLVRAFARIAPNLPDAVLLLVGGGEMDQELRQLVADIKLGERVIMPGRVPHNRVPGVYALIDVLAYPRYSVRLTELVTPLKPLEAMAMGKVLVASDIGGHRELIRDNETGVLFKAGDEAVLAQVLQRLFSDSSHRERIALQAGKWVREHHSWEKTTEVYAGLYRSLLATTQSKPEIQESEG